MELAVIILVLVIQTFVLFFVNYFQEKGKNLATKEDIAGITNEIEAIKALHKQNYDLSKAEREFYNEMIKVIEDFLAAVKKYETKTGGKDTLTKEMLAGDENLREKYIKFIDSTNIILARAFVFLGEEKYETLKKAIDDEKSDFPHFRINLLDAMRKSIHPSTKMQGEKDSKNFPYSMLDK